MMFLKMTSEQLNRFLANPTPETARQIQAENAAAPKARKPSGQVDIEATKHLVESRVTSEDLDDARLMALELIEKIATDPAVRANPKLAIGLLSGALLTSFKVGFASAIDEIVNGEISLAQLNACRTVPPATEPTLAPRKRVGGQVLNSTKK